MAVSVNSVVAFFSRHLKWYEPVAERRQLGRDDDSAFVAGEAAELKAQSQVVDEEETVPLVQELAVGAQIGNRDGVRISATHVRFVEVVRRDRNRRWRFVLVVEFSEPFVERVDDAVGLRRRASGSNR